MRQTRRKKTGSPGKVFLVALLAATLWIINLLWYKPFSLELFYERMFLQFCLQQPEIFTSTGIYHALDFTGQQGKLNDLSAEKQVKQMELVTRNFEMLRSYRRSQQTPEQLLHTETFDYYLEKQIFRQQFWHYQHRLNPLSGPQATVVIFMLHHHQVNSLKDAEFYLDRLAATGQRNQQLAELLQVTEINGTLPPRMVLEQTLAQLQEMAVAPATASIFYADFAEKLRNCTALTPEAQKELLFEAKIEIEDNLVPSCQLLQRRLEEVLPAAPATASLQNLPDGEAWFYFLLEDALTTEVNRQVLQDAAEKLQEHIAEQMRQTAAEEGCPDNSTASLPCLFAGADQQHLQDFTDLQQLWQQQSEKLPGQAKHLNMPALPGNLPEIAPLPVTHRQVVTWGLYNPASLGSNNNAVCMLQPETMKLYGQQWLPALVAREVFPGGHLQQSWQTSRTSLPSMRRWLQFKWFTEGWKLYSLLYTAENNGFESPAQKAGALQLALLEVVKLQQALQVFLDGKAPEQAIVSLQAETGLPAEVARASLFEVMANPAQAAAAVTGALRIAELHQLARKEGRSTADFHLWVLQQGALPWKLLQKTFFSDFLKEQHPQELATNP